MQRYVIALQQGHDARRMADLLARIVGNRALHARMLNTLARLEYVGVRKMLKSRRAERLDLDGLQHMLEETVHAVRLKRAAVAAGQGAVAVKTFADADTLAGDHAEAYFQAVDHAAEAALADLPEAARTEVNYLLTSAAIEVRAEVFYPAYESALQAAGAEFSVASILRDEDKHLVDMAAALERALPDWRRRLDQVLAREQALYGDFMAALERACGSTARGLETAPGNARVPVAEA
jgi:hypothetical protein